MSSILSLLKKSLYREVSHLSGLKGLHRTEIQPNVLKLPRREKGEGRKSCHLWVREEEMRSWLSMAKNQNPQILEDT